jgi:hypothetical protein
MIHYILFLRQLNCRRTGCSTTPSESKRSLENQTPFYISLFTNYLTSQKLFQRRLADAVGVAHLLGFQTLVVYRSDNIFL